MAKAVGESRSRVAVGGRAVAGPASRFAPPGGWLAWAVRSSSYPHAEEGCRSLRPPALQPELPAIRRTDPAADALLEAGKVANLHLAAPAFHGLRLDPQHPFSFWRALGPVTRWGGYQYGMELQGRVRGPQPRRWPVPALQRALRDGGEAGLGDPRAATATPSTRSRIRAGLWGLDATVFNGPTSTCGLRRATTPCGSRCRWRATSSASARAAFGPPASPVAWRRSTSGSATRPEGVYRSNRVVRRICASARRASCSRKATVAVNRRRLLDPGRVGPELPDVRRGVLQQPGDAEVFSPSLIAASILPRLRYNARLGPMGPRRAEGNAMVRSMGRSGDVERGRCGDEHPTGSPHGHFGQQPRGAARRQQDRDRVDPHRETPTTRACSSGSRRLPPSTRWMCRGAAIRPRCWWSPSVNDGDERGALVGAAQDPQQAHAPAQDPGPLAVPAAWDRASTQACLAEIGLFKQGGAALHVQRRPGRCQDGVHRVVEEALEPIDAYHPAYLFDGRIDFELGGGWTAPASARASPPRSTAR